MSEENISEDAVKLLRDEHHAFVSTCFLYCLTFFFFMLPIKFGNSFLPSTVPSYPESLIYGGWPTYLLSILAGLFLIAAIVIYRPKRISSTNFKIISGWLFVGVSTAAFGYYKYNLLYYFYSINQIIIALLMAILAAICLEYESRSRKFIIAGICGGLIYTVLNGAYQYWWGFEDNIRFYKEMEAQGMVFPTAQINRIMQKLVFSHFTISNSFAAHIILTLPVTVFIILKKLDNKHTTVCRVFGTSMILFSLATFMSSDQSLLAIVTMIVGMLLCFGLDHLPEEAIRITGYIIIALLLTILALTKSRAGMISFGAGLLISGAICFQGKTRKLCAAALIAGALAGIYFAPRVASFQVRLGYYDALIEMFKEKPMGYGFGGFAEFYNRTKGPGIEESNSPHSFFFGYLGQGGLFAGLSVIFCYVISVITVARQKFDRWLKFSLIGGFSAWFLHSQLDFNIMIPGTVAIAAVLLMMVTVKKKGDTVQQKSCTAIFTALIPIAITVIYFASDHALSQRKYTQFHEMVNDVKEIPPIDKVKNAMEKVAEQLPYSTAPYDEAASWSMQQYTNLRGQDAIQGYAYLSLAEEALSKAVDIDPKRSSFYTRLARIYFDMKNFDQTQAMLDKAFELYPYNSAALTLEFYILTEWYKREPTNTRYLMGLLNNKTVNLEITLGQMNFHDHLMISRNQLKRMYDDLDKRVREIYTDIDLIRKSGLKVDVGPIIQKIKEIHLEAQKVAGVDR